MRDERLIRYAKANRNQMSEPEAKLWSCLRRGQLGVRFRRQHPIGPYIADFACLSLKLVVEVDGNQHIGSHYDRARDGYMRRRGWTVLRYWADEVMFDLEMLLDDVVGKIEKLSSPA
ncbi:MAG: DUF559 domain-containing protein [Acidimicrobiia bacterium]|nr:DUF559 domain-containing protein [Acidimicrobiia bacterium]